MKATLQRSKRTGGTTVGSTGIHYDFLSMKRWIGIFPHTLTADDDSHAIMAHLS